jgi:predicted transcriptional regulator
MQKYQTEQGEVELDSILTMIGNPVRRNIIKRLSQEPSYTLQLSKELGVGQQLIAKHLDALEQAGIVTSSLEPSPNGPSRKNFALKKSIALSINFAPHLFALSIVNLGMGDAEEYAGSKQAQALTSRIERIIRSSENQNRISGIGKIISDLDKKLEELEQEKASLLYIRNLAMNEASKLIKESEKNTDTRRIMYYILDSHNKNIAEISESVNLREDLVRRILDRIETDLGV